MHNGILEETLCKGVKFVISLLPLERTGIFSAVLGEFEL
jgi:hypothetical protein